MELPEDYMIDFEKLVQTEGIYDNTTGLYVEGSSNWADVRGIVVPLSPSELRYAEGGTYTIEDRKVYVYEAFQEGQKIRYKGKVYTIDAEKDYFDTEGLYIYVAKRDGEVNA
jgi:hypothetical protein